MKEQALALVIAMVLDALLGDRENWPHPVRWMGTIYGWLDDLFRKANWRSYETGLFTVLFIGGIFFVGTGLLLDLLPLGWPRLCGEAFLFYWCLSVRTLSDEARGIQKALTRHRLSEARKLLARVVGRDTKKLSASEIVRAVVETLGESFVDGFLSPVFWGLLLGVPGAFFFKAVSTGDSMIGHPEEPYTRFGWASARLDDAMNFIPARLSVLILAPAATLAGLSTKGLITAFTRDRSKHASPNAAHGEAAFAGALGVRLGGLNYYGGKSYRQQCLNEKGRPCVVADISRALRLLWSAAGLLGFLLFLAGVLWP
jgi:adenosylcobinamide-phosphate synthase